MVTVSAAWAAPSSAATFTVDSTGDAADAVPGDGDCDTGIDVTPTVTATSTPSATATEPIRLHHWKINQPSVRAQPG